MNIPEILLAVCILILLWRVWRLEGRLRALDLGLAYKANADWVSSAMNETLARCTAATEQRVKALARAFGYEWKRTEAKEGWEKKKVATFGMGELYTYQRAMDRELDDMAYSVFGSDRRKGDRRKAGEAAAEIVYGVKPRTKKKPRRAH